MSPRLSVFRCIIPDCEKIVKSAKNPQSGLESAALRVLYLRVKENLREIFYRISVMFLNTLTRVLATVDMVLMKISKATPTTSLRVSPTVSPVTPYGRASPCHGP